MRRSKLGRSALRRTGDASSSSSGGGASVAAWDIAKVRYYFIDYDGGSDANTGYLDVAAGTVFTGAQLTNRAFKTWEHFFTVFPRVGAGRRVVILWKNRAAGATYLKIDGVTADVVDFTGVSGYAYRLTRGSTDLTNSVTDRLLCGHITALAGPNGDGSFSVAAGATTTAFSVSAGTLTAEPGIIGWRVRFVGNVTVALANVCTNIQGNTSSAVTPGEALGAAPGTGEQFFIEMPGCRVGQYLPCDNAAPEATAGTLPIPSTTPSGAYDVGVGVTSTTAVAFRMAGPGLHACSAIEQLDITLAVDSSTQWEASDCQHAQILKTYTDEVGSSRLVGFGGRARGGWLHTRITLYESEAFSWVNAGGAIGAIDPRLVLIGQIGNRGGLAKGSYLGSRTRMQNIIEATGVPGGTAAATGLGTLGSILAAIPSRSINSIALNQCWPRLLNWQITNCAQNAIQINNALAIVGGVMMLDGITGSTGNLGFGFDFSGCVGVKFILGRATANTVTGTSGDIQTGGTAALVQHTVLTRTNVLDSAGNEFLGTAGHIVDTCIPMTNSSGGALAVGDVVRGNGTTGQVTSAIADTLANSIVEGIMVTAPASAAAGYMAPLGSGTPSVTCSAAPTPGAIVYLSTTTTRQGTTTKPVLSGTQQLVQLGRAARVSGNNAQLTIIPLQENAFDDRPIPAEISNAAASFSASQTWLIATGTLTADRAFTLEALSTLAVATRRMVSDLTTGGAFNILLTPNAADAIDGGVAGAAVAIPAGSRQSITVRKTPTLGWKIE